MATQRPDEMIVLKGFRVEIFLDGTRSQDDGWETCTGGALLIDFDDASGAPREGSAAHLSAKGGVSPGHKSISEIVLRGPLTASRKWIGHHMNALFRDPSARFSVTLTEIKRDGSDGRSFNYHECFITGYATPALGASSGNLYEEVRIKPVRVELK